MLFTQLKKTTSAILALALFMNHLPLAQAREIRQKAKTEEIIALVNSLEDNRSLLRLVAEILGEDSATLEKNMSAEKLDLDAKPARLKLVDGNLTVEGLDGQIQITNPTKGILSYSGRSWRYDQKRDYQKNFIHLRGLWEPHWRFKKKAATGGLAWLNKIDLIPAAEAQQLRVEVTPEIKELLTVFAGSLVGVVVFAWLMSMAAVAGAAFVVGTVIATIAGLVLYYYRGGGRQLIDRQRRNLRNLRLSSLPCEGEEFTRISTDDPALANSLTQICRNPNLRDGANRTWARVNQRIQNGEIRMAGIANGPRASSPEPAPSAEAIRAL
jgi:hypothetical protein